MFFQQKIFSIFISFIITFNANALDIFYDSQLDGFINEISEDLILKSGLKDVNFYIVKSPEINAFATADKEIVFYSGLIEKTKNQSQLQGVMAHEIGHLIAQHHIKSRIKNINNGIPAIAGTILGIGAVIAGAPQAGYAAIVSGSAVGISNQLVYSRENENEADSIALKLLDKSNQSVQGLSEFFAILEKQEQSFVQKQPEFLNTHPSTQNRKNFIQNNLVIEKKNQPTKEYLLFKAKTIALTQEPAKTINIYMVKDESAEKNLALAIAYNYQGLYQKSIEHLNKSKKLGLQNKWYFDMLGQFEYEHTEFKKSIKSYKQAQAEGNNSWIIDFQIAQSYFALNDIKALDYYFKALAKFKYFYYTYKRIGEFYAQQKQLTKAHYYLASYYIKINDNKQAKEHLILAQEFYKKEGLKDDNLISVIKEMLANIKKDKD